MPDLRRRERRIRAPELIFGPFFRLFCLERGVFSQKALAERGRFMIKYQTNISFQLKGTDYHEDDMATVEDQTETENRVSRT